MGILSSFKADKAFLIGSSLSIGAQLGGAIGGLITADTQGKAYELQSKATKLQEKQLENRYREESARLIGSYKARASASGLKVSGSVADSLNQSLTQLNMEESNKIFDLKMRSIQSNYMAEESRRRGITNLLTGATGAASSALGAYATYKRYWGSGSNMGDNNG